MQAIQIKQYGPADTLSSVELAEPIPGPDDVLIRVHATGVNRLDVLLREGEVFRVPLPRIPGSDFSGEIVQTGKNVPINRLYQRVMAAPILSCGKCAHCQNGNDNLCHAFGTIGSTIDGGYAHYVCIPARNAIALPDHISFEAAASFALTYATAAAMLRKGGLHEGQTVLILGATGGLGLAAVELAQLQGARVIAVSRQPERAQVLEARGAWAVVDPADRLAPAVMNLTEGKGVDLVFEHVGAATFEQSLASLASHGTMLLGGVTRGLQASIDLKAVFTKRLQIIGCRGSGRTDLNDVFKLLCEGKLKPHIGEILPLNEAARAHQLLDSGTHFGKIILIP
jgi:2-desacetyl-2-hydroxyethyl bacteriochlorophyllide A dehydrogenase